MAVPDLLFPLVVIPDQMTKIITELWHWHVSGSLGLFIFRRSYLRDWLNMGIIFLNNGAFQEYYWFRVTIRFLAPLFVITVLYTAIVISLKTEEE